MSKTSRINVQGSPIAILKNADEDFISLTDMVKSFDGGGSLIEQWLKNKDTLLFLAAWERLNNPSFNSIEFEGIRMEAGRNSYFMSAKKWIEKTNATGLMARAGRYGGTFAHKDIAFEFGSWLSPEFKLYLIKEFQRLKDEENRRQSLDWNLNRTLAKLNYRIHTDAIKGQLVTSELTQEQIANTYASEADILNVALFGMTAKQWRDANPDKAGNIREYATIEQLLVLANIENMNAEFIKMGLPPKDRLARLNKIALSQLATLAVSPHASRLTAGAAPSNK